VAKIDEAERHVATPAAGPDDADGDGAARAAPRPAPAPVALAEPPVERAAPVEPTPEESGDGVAGRPETDAERTKPSAQRKKQQSRRRRKHGRRR
jgi:hypothetical protein